MQKKKKEVEGEVEAVFTSPVRAHLQSLGGAAPRAGDAPCVYPSLTTVYGDAEEQVHMKDDDSTLLNEFKQRSGRKPKSAEYLMLI